jgi:hypothetical protein
MTLCEIAIGGSEIAGQLTESMMMAGRMDGPIELRMQVSVC